MKGIILLVLFSCLIGGCSSNHLVADGVCLTCFNNPLSGEALNYNKSEQSNEVASRNSGASKSQRKNNFYINPINRSNIFYHWAASTDKPYNNIEFLARKYYSKYRAANEFEKPRILEQVSPEIIQRIDMAKNTTNLSYISNTRLKEYNFSSNSFEIRVPTSSPLSINVFGKPSRDIGIVYDIPSGQKVSIDVDPKLAEEAIKAAGGGRRWAGTEVYFNLVGFSDSCDQKCSMKVKPYRMSLMNYLTKQVIGTQEI